MAEPKGHLDRLSGRDDERGGAQEEVVGGEAPWRGDRRHRQGESREERPPPRAHYGATPG